MNKKYIIFLSLMVTLGANAQKEASKNAFINWFSNNKLLTAGVGFATLGFGTDKFLTKLEHGRCERKNQSMNLDSDAKGINLDTEAFNSLVEQRLQRGWKVLGDVAQDQADVRCNFTLQRKTRLGKTIKEDWTVKMNGLKVEKDKVSNEINKISYPDGDTTANVFRKRVIEGSINYIPWFKRALVGMGVVSFACSFLPSFK